MGSTIRRIDTGQGGNRFVTRTYAVMRPGMESTASDLRTAARLQQKKFDQRFPQLAGVEMQYKWSGHLCLSLNSVSVVGELEAGLYSACVQNGLGTARGTLTGMAAAELACGVSSDLTRHFLSEAPPRRLPPRPLREIGANAFMRWKEWRARGIAQSPIPCAIATLRLPFDRHPLHREGGEVHVANLMSDRVKVEPESFSLSVANANAIRQFNSGQIG